MRPLVPEWVETLKPYVPGKPIEETEREYGVKNPIKLASNENPLGPSPKALALADAAAHKVHLYPDGANFSLVHAVAKHLGVSASEVFVGSGSNEIIELVIRTFTTPDDEALLSAGSFMMYKVALQSHGRRFREVPMKSGYRYDLEAMAAALTPKTRLVYLANPDNPTSTAFSKSELDAFLAKVPPETLVVLDEAYFEYVDWPEYPNGLDYYRARPNVLVLRTFSKIYGLAGLRVGYGIMQAPLVGYLNRTRMPFNLTSMAQAMAVAALDDAAHVKASRELTWKGLRFLEGALKDLGIPVPHSHANFVFADLGRPSGPVFEALLRKGVITRPVPGSGWPQALRISCGLPAENERLVTALREVLKT
ncbi:MAG: histidinol-phosphate transaminase [Myxococcaceae bacterium]|nr:histidinol-phosphate transaminase [Myxococcaceae bacterium]